MKTMLRVARDKALFVVLGLDPALHEAATALAYGEVEGGWGFGVPVNTPHLEQIYTKWSSVVEEMILQKARRRPVPWEAALLGFIERVEGQGIDWWLTGSAALSARGLDIQPGDLDLTINDEASTRRLTDLLLDDTIEPLRDSSEWVAQWFGRAFIGACIDWIGVPNERFGVSDFGPTAARQLETIQWQGHELRVPPLALQRAVNERRGKLDRVAQIDRWLAGRN